MEGRGLGSPGGAGVRAGVWRSPWWLRTVRQPMQQLWRLAKARRPPTLPVSTVLQRVWSPPAGERRQWAQAPPNRPRVPPCSRLGIAPEYSAARLRHGPRPGWAQRCAGAAWQAAAPGSTACRWAGCAPAQRGGPANTAAEGLGLCSSAGSGAKGTASHGVGLPVMMVGNDVGQSWDPGTALQGMASVGGQGSRMVSETPTQSLAVSCDPCWGPWVGVLRLYQARIRGHLLELGREGVQ